MPNGGRGEATGNVYFFTGIIREGQIRKRGQNLFVAILFNSRGIDRSVEGGREGGRGIVCSLYLLGSNRPVSISRSGALRSILRGRGREGIGWIDREKGRNGVSGINSGINNPYGCATIDNNGDTKGCETLATE